MNQTRIIAKARREVLKMARLIETYDFDRFGDLHPHFVDTLEEYVLEKGGLEALKKDIKEEKEAGR